MVIFIAINIFSKGTTTMATTLPDPVDLAANPNTNLGTEGQVVTTAPTNLATDPNTNLGTEGQVVQNQTQVTNEDPFEAARAAAEQANNETPPPTETAVNVEPTDPEVAAMLEQQQFINREILAQEAKEVEPGVGTGISTQGVAYDDNGNLMPGWNVDELGQPYYVGGGFVAPATQDLALEGREAARKAAAQKELDNRKKSDWRARLTLAPSAKYLYRIADTKDILYPLKATDGVIFPYTPTIQTSYKANYDPAELIHSNYKYYFYKNSSVDDVTINATFTAQDTVEANYLLAVIHFFKSVTKMFYGQDKNPVRGTPPPLCYLTGFGSYQFDNHPLLISNFSFSMPNDVDYIRAGSVTTWGGVNIGSIANKGNTNKYIPGLSDILGRLSGAKLQFGGVSKQPEFKSLAAPDSTYVPTKLDITITGHPVVTRNDISNNFSVTDYATGKLLQGSKRSGGGIW